jgi:WD40 repeat protein
VQALAWLPDGEHFVVATGNGELSLFDRHAHLLGRRDDGQASFGHASMAVAAPKHPLAPPGGVVIALCREQQPLSFWACRPGADEPLRRLPGPGAERDPVRPRTLRFTSAHFLVAGLEDGRVAILGADGKTVWRSSLDDRHASYIDDVAVSPSGCVAVAGGLAVAVWQWRQASDGPELERGPMLQCESMATAVAFPPDDDETLLVGLGDGSVILFDLANETRRLVGYHDRSVRAVAFTSDGMRMLSAGQDGVAKVWTRKGELFVELPHGGTVHGAAFSPDGQHVLTGSSVLTARIWPVTDEELGRLARELPFRGLEHDERQRLLFGGR